MLLGNGAAVEASQHIIGARIQMLSNGGGGGCYGRTVLFIFVENEGG